MKLFLEAFLVLYFLCLIVMVILLVLVEFHLYESISKSFSCFNDSVKLCCKFSSEPKTGWGLAEFALWELHTGWTFVLLIILLHIQLCEVKLSSYFTWLEQIVLRLIIFLLFVRCYVTCCAVLLDSLNFHYISLISFNLVLFQLF